MIIVVIFIVMECEVVKQKKILQLLEKNEIILLQSTLETNKKDSTGEKNNKRFQLQTLIVDCKLNSSNK